MKKVLVAACLCASTVMPARALTYTVNVSSNQSGYNYFDGLTGFVNVSAIHVNLLSTYNFVLEDPRPVLPTSFPVTIQTSFSFFNGVKQKSFTPPTANYGLTAQCSNSTHLCLGSGSTSVGIDLLSDNFDTLLGNNIYFMGVPYPSTFGSRGTSLSAGAEITYTYTLLSVPEPAAWATVTLGLGLAGAFMRRRAGSVRFA